MPIPTKETLQRWNEDNKARCKDFVAAYVFATRHSEEHDDLSREQIEAEAEQEYLNASFERRLPRLP